MNQLNEPLFNNESIPNENLHINSITNDDGKIVLNIKEELINTGKLYIAAYDKKSNKILAVHEACISENNNIIIDFQDSFLDALEEFPEFTYARLCILTEQDNSNKMYFIKNNKLDKESYSERLCLIETIRQSNDKNWILYYSKGSLVSIKMVDDKTYYSMKNSYELINVENKNNKLFLSLCCPCLKESEYEFALISKTTKDESYLLKIHIEKIKKYNSSRNCITAVLDLENIDSSNYDAYEMVVYDSNGKSNVYINNYIRNNSSVNSDNGFEILVSGDKNELVDIQIAEKIYEYMASIIIAVYNTGLFIGEALNSILNQDITPLNKYIIGNSSDNYKERIYKNVLQVIMVDDGSTDNSGIICDEYAKDHFNFKVIHKENGGVSSARNAGISVAEGKYLNFMDSDDKFSDNVIAECINYFEKHYDEIEVLSFPVYLFGDSNSEHWLNTKFTKDYLILDLEKDYKKSQTFVNSSFFKTETVKNNYLFDTELKIAEDIKFIYSILINKKAKLGLINKCKYWYRKSSIGEDSLMKKAKTDENYYYNYLTCFIDFLIEESIRRYGCVPKYVQYIIAQQLQWRFTEDKDGKIAISVIGEKNFQKYKEHIFNELKYIDADIILDQSKIFVEQKRFMLTCKDPGLITKYYDDEDIIYYAAGKPLAKESRLYTRLEFIKIANEELFIEGYNMSFDKASEFLLIINGNEYSVDVENRDNSIYSLGEKMFFATSFKFSMKLLADDTIIKIAFAEKIEGKIIYKKDIRFAKLSPLSNTYSKSYYQKETWIVRLENSELVLRNTGFSCNINLYNSFETEFINQVSKMIKSNIEKKALELRKKILPLRNAFLRPGARKVWLISDRVNMAGDNGEALFLYLMSRNIPDVDIYFVINDNCKDYRRLKKYGNVIVQNSEQHILLHMVAEYIISSQANEYILNPFYHYNTTDIFRDIVYSPKFVFLQHGITKDDVSKWLNRFNKDWTGLVVAANPEYKSMFDYDYYYSEKEIWLTGFPRHDRLYRDEKRYITIMPTWRKYLSQPSEQDPEVNVLKPGFENTDFFRFYNTLINDEKLINAAKQYGFTICFMPHPNVMNNLDSFNHNPEVLFFGTDKPYREIYAESNLVITDYSSAVMDFAFLRKPIVYCHFDADEFFAGEHVYTRGYFDYERDGFGEVTYDEASLVDVIIDYMKNDCKLKKVYYDRMEKFFAFKDDKNCERVYKKLKEN